MFDRRITLSAATVLTLGAALLPAVPAQAASSIQITYAYYDSPGKDTHSNKVINGEWIRITNKGSKARSLKGWTLRDNQDHVYRFGTYTLKAGASVKIHTGKGVNTSTNRYWGRSWYVWNNTTDTATLRNASKTTVDRCSWRSGRVDARTC